MLLGVSYDLCMLFMWLCFGLSMFEDDECELLECDVEDM